MGKTELILNGFNEAGILHPEKPRFRRFPGSSGKASMRPGFYTRKSPDDLADRVAVIEASMRPGFYTRKSRARPPARTRIKLASMRPGFYTRKS